jgi:hypothetical protein
MDGTVVENVEHDVFSAIGGACVSGGYEKLLAKWALADFPSEGVFTATASEEEDSHYLGMSFEF